MAAKNGNKTAVVLEPQPLPRYHFPRECLEQDYFTLGGTGIRGEASLNLNMLANKHFVSPLEYLLRQLSADGYDVAACEAEFSAMREHIFNERRNLGDLHKILEDLLHNRPSASLTAIRHREEDKKRRDIQFEKRWRKEFPALARSTSDA